MPSRSEEDELLELAVSGDGEALARLLEQSGPSVRAALIHKVPTRWQAVLSVDDVMQESYIDAFLDIQRFDPRGEGSFRAWLTTLANRNLLDALRMLEAEKRGRNRRQVRPVTTDGSLVALYDQLGGSNTTPSHCASRGEASARLKRAIEQLPPAYRKVVEMYDLAGHSVEYVAKTLGRSPGAVFMLRSRAHRRICEMMGTPSQFLTGTH